MARISFEYAKIKNNIDSRVLTLGSSREELSTLDGVVDATKAVKRTGKGFNM